jgi:hypothetical protein
MAARTDASTTLAGIAIFPYHLGALVGSTQAKLDELLAYFGDTRSFRTDSFF